MAKFEVTVTSRAVEAAKRRTAFPYILSFFLPSHFQGLKKVGSLQSPPGRSSRHLRCWEKKKALHVVRMLYGRNPLWIGWRKEGKRGCHAAAAAADDG